MLKIKTKEEQNPEADQGTSSGLIHHTVRMFEQTSLNHSFAWLISISRNRTSSTKYLIETTSRSATAALATNMANVIKSHNQNILKENNETSSEKKYNCGNKNLCPLDGACLTNNIVYREATVTTTFGSTRTYIGMTEHEFKTRYNNHKLSFKDRKHSHDTVLSKHIWDLKDGNMDYKIN